MASEHARFDPFTMMEESTREPLILVVDDVKSNLRLIQGFLEPQRYRVVTATSAREGFEALHRETPDLILLDAVMPEMDGFEMLRILRGEAATRHLPVIMVTALSDISDKARGQEAGADDFVCKPFDRAELLLRVKSLLRIKSLHDQLALKITELEQAKQQLRELAEHDGLTGLYNKRYFTQAANRECERARRYDRNFGIVLVDIDHFKKINDTHGHPTGDHVLREAARVMVGRIRKIDTLARYGGEEFVHLVLEAGAEATGKVGLKHRNAVAEREFTDEHGRPIGPVTISVGVASFPEDGDSIEALVKAADRRLYLAKQSGRNRVVTTDAVDTSLVSGR